MLTATILTSPIPALTILIHYEAIGFVHRWQGSTWGGVRGKVVSGVFFLFATHSLEIWLFAAGIYVDKDILLLGGLEGAFTGTRADYLYISMVTYASVG